MAASKKITDLELESRDDKVKLLGFESDRTKLLAELAEARKSEVARLMEVNQLKQAKIDQDAKQVAEN